MASDDFWAKQRAFCACGHQFMEHWNNKREGFQCSRCACLQFTQKYPLPSPPEGV